MELQTGAKTPLKSFDDFRNRYVASTRPDSVMIEVTYLCNLRCQFCYNPTHEAISELTTEQMIYALDQLKKLGVLKLTLSGGECLARPDLFTIIEEAQKRQFMVVLFSNAVFVDRKMADRILDSCVSRFETSIHGACAKTHERQTCVKGSFDKTIRALEYFKGTHLPVILKTTVTRFNQNELWGIKAIADRFGAEVKFEMVITPRVNGDTSPLEQNASDDFRRYFWSRECDELRGQSAVTPRDFEASSGINCTSGRATLLMDPWGNLFPCAAWRESFGNILTDDIVEAWEKSPILQNVRETTSRIPDEALPKGKRAFSAFCPGIARYTEGSPMAVYESEQKNMDLRYARAMAEGVVLPKADTVEKAAAK